MSISNTEKEARVENLLQKLEDACARAEAPCTTSTQQRDEPYSSPSYVPTRIRDIADQCLSPSRQHKEQISPSHNSALQNELRRAQDMLDQSRQDCKSLSAKYLAVSDKLKLIATLEEKIADLILENRKLNSNLVEQEERHALHLKAYHDGQEKHSKLVLKLQNKVLQYKDACGGLQLKLHNEHDAFKRETVALQGTIDHLKEEVKKFKEQLHKSKEEDGAALKSAFGEAENQEQRANQLFASNSKLRQQLEDMNEMNQRLSEDVHQLSIGWNEAQSQMKEKDEMWSKILTEECGKAVQTQKAYLKTTLKGASEVKEDLKRVKLTTTRDLGLLKGELLVFSEQLAMRVEQYCGSHYNMKTTMTNALQQRDGDYTKVLTELNTLRCEHEALKTQHVMEVEDREKKIKELTSSLEQAEHTRLKQEKYINELKSRLADMEGSEHVLIHKHMSAQSTNASLIKECETLKSALDEIVQLFVISGATPLTATCQCSSRRPAVSSSSIPSPSALSTPPTKCDCHGDAIRLKDWSVSMVKHGMDAREKGMKTHELEQSSMAEALKGKQDRIKLLEEEIKAHSSATSVMKSDLGMCHANNQDLNKVKLKLEHQLEEMNLQKQQVERKLTQTTACLDSILEEKSKKEASNASLEEAIAGLRDQLTKMDQEKELLGSRLVSKDNEGRHLELQLQASEEEVKKLRARMSELELHKMELEKELNHTRMCVSKLELEKVDLQNELRKVKESEYSIMATLNELRMANTRLEADKRLLTQSLQETTSIKTKLDEENAKLEQVRFSSEEQIQGLVSSARQLNEQIAQLDKSLQEVEASKGELQIERDRQCQEVAGLVESLNRAKEAIAELQLQKGKLNSSITKLAREKGDLIQEKAEFEKEKMQLQESLRSAEERVKTTRAAMERLEQRIEELDIVQATSQQTAFKLQEANFLLQQEKHDIKLEMDCLQQAKEQALSLLQNEKALELQQVLMKARGQENDLQAAIVKLESSCDRRLSEMEEQYAEKVEVLTSEHIRVVSQLQEAITTLQVTNQNEVCRITSQKDQLISHMEKDKKLLQEQLVQIQELHTDVCEKLHSQQAQSMETIAGLKLQLQTTQSTVSTLEKELSTAEHHMHTLQVMLDDIKTSADGQAESLKFQLKTASETISTLEHTQDNLLMDTKQLKSKKEAIKGQLDAAHRQLQRACEEREGLRVECQGLKQDVCSLREELAGSKMAVTNLTESLSKTDNSRLQAEKDVKMYYGSLLTLEQAHARLTSDHASLQAVLTSCETNATSLQLELKQCKEKGEALARTNEQLTKRVSILEDHLTTLTNSCKQLEEENDDYKLKVRNMEEEKDLQKAAILRLQDTAKAESVHRASENLKLSSDLETCKKNCSTLRDEVAELEFELQSSQRGYSDLESKLVAAESLARHDKDKQADLMTTCKALQERLSELLSILNGTLGLKLDLPFTKQAVNKGVPPVDVIEGGAPDSTGYLSESGIECSLDGTQGSRLGDGGAASSYGTQVRDTILSLHKQVMEGHRQKCDAASSLQLMALKLKALEEEKGTVEAQLKMAQATCSSLNMSMEALRKKHAENELMYVQHSEKMQGAQLASKHLQEHSERLAMEVSVLKSHDAAKEAELVQLQVKHDDLKLRLAETEQQLVMARESALILDKSLNQITRKEAELVSKTHEREVQLERLREDRLQLEERVTRHKEEISKVKKDKDTLEAQLQQLVQSEDHSRRKAEALEHSVSDEELKKSEMTSKLQELESQLRMEQAEKIMVESSFSEVQTEKKALEARLKSLEVSLESATESSVASQQLCSSLERESHHLRGEVQRLREENERVMVELKAVQFQLQKVEHQQASKLSHRVLSVTQQNTELLVTVRSLKAVVGSKDEEYKRRLESMQKEMEVLCSTYKSSETRWKDKEKDYEATIGQLERKARLENVLQVKSLEDKMESVRQKRTEYLERVREHEGSISGMKPHLDQQPIPHSSAGGGAKCVLPVRLSEEAMRLKQSTLELVQSATPFLTPTHHQTLTTPLTSTPIKKA